MSYLLRLGLIALAMTAFLSFMLVSHAHMRASGTEILVPVEGYDPRDPLLGHYSRIRIAANRLEVAGLAGEDEFEREDNIFVVFESGEDGVWAPVELASQRPSGERVFLHGLVLYSGSSDGEWVEVTDPETGETRFDYVEHEMSRRTLTVDYRLNRYYASRETAQELDILLRDESQNPRLILSVQSDGTAIIKGLEINGERRIERLW